MHLRLCSALLAWRVRSRYDHLRRQAKFAQGPSGRSLDGFWHDAQQSRNLLWREGASIVLFQPIQQPDDGLFMGREPGKQDVYGSTS